MLRLSFVAAEDLAPSEWDALHAHHISPKSPLNLRYISPRWDGLHAHRRVRAVLARHADLLPPLPCL